MDYLKELIRVLGIEKKLYLELTDMAKEKQKVIINNNIEQLANYLTQEQDLIADIENVEKERRQAVIGLCTELDMPDKELSFTKLRELLDESAKSKLDQFKESLLEVLEELHSVNETNRILIEEAMRINDFTLRLLTQAAMPSTKPTYTKTGVDKEKSQHLIDKRA